MEPSALYLYDICVRVCERVSVCLFRWVWDTIQPNGRKIVHMMLAHFMLSSRFYNLIFFGTFFHTPNQSSAFAFEILRHDIEHTFSVHWMHLFFTWMSRLFGMADQIIHSIAIDDKSHRIFFYSLHSAHFFSMIRLLSHRSCDPCRFRRCDRFTRTHTHTWKLCMYMYAIHIHYTRSTKIFFFVQTIYLLGCS